MTQYCYVRTHADGTGTRASATAFTAIQTGDWDTTLASVGDYYSSIIAAISNNTLVSGDIVICSSIHLQNYGATTTWTLPNGVTVISVNDTAIDEELKGAIEKATGAAYHLTLAGATLGGKQYHRNMEYISQNDLRLANVSEASFYAKNCTLRLIGVSPGDTLSVSGADGIYVSLIDTDIQLPNVSAFNSSGAITLARGSALEIKGGALIANTNKPDFIFNAQGIGGGSVDVDGFDMSSINGSGSICAVESAGDDNFTGLFKNCIYPAGITLNTTALQKPGQRIEAYSTNTGDQYYDYQIEDYYGTVETETTIVRTGAAQYEGTNELSLKVTPTTANCIKGVAGLTFRLGSKYKDLSTAQTVTVYILIDNTSVAATALDDLDINVRIKHTNNTNECLGDWIESTSTSILKAGTTLTTAAGVWEGENANAKEYKITKDLGALSNVLNGLVTVEIEISVATLDANDQIYVCPDFTLTDT